MLAFSADGLDEQRLDDFAVLCSPHAPKFVVTEQRARSIGIRVSTAMVLPLPPLVSVSTIFELAASAENEGHFAGKAEAASHAATAAIRLLVEPQPPGGSRSGIARLDVVEQKTDSTVTLVERTRPFQVVVPGYPERVFQNLVRVSIMLGNSSIPAPFLRCTKVGCDGNGFADPGAGG